MGLLTIPTINKSVSSNLGLSKADLFALAPVLADSYFSVQANVRFAHFVYVSNPGKQIEILRFDLSAASPSAPFLVSARSREVFELQRVILEDFDGGTLAIERAQLPSGFDVTLGAAPIGGIPLGQGETYLSVIDGLRMLLTSDTGFTANTRWMNQLSRGGGYTLYGLTGLANNVFGTQPAVDINNFYQQSFELTGSDGYSLSGGTSAFTLFVVASIPNGYPTDKTMVEAYGASTEGKRVAIVAGNDNNSAVLRSSSTSNKRTQTFDPVVQSTKKAVLTVNKPEGASLSGTDFWLNTKKQSTFIGTDTPINLVDANNNPYPRLTLGNGSSTNNAAGGQIGAVLAYNRSLTDAEIGTVVQSLKTKYSITHA